MIRWIETHCVFTQGEWIGKPFRLLGWQKRLILELFALRPDGLRIYRWALWGVPKKQGKTELAAALGLYFLIGDGEPSPLVVCAAASDAQADLVFGAARTMCEQSPTLSRIAECFDKEILVPSIPGAKLQRVAAVAGTNDGPSIFVVICDELHEWRGKKGRDVWTVLTNGTGARRQPMVLQITTAGFDPDSVCFEQYEHGCRVRDGEIDDPRYHFFWVEAPAEADYRDPAVWEAANPSYGVTVQAEFYADQLMKKPENTFRRYYLNQWTEADELWLPSGAWEACEVPGMIAKSSPVVLAVDVGTKKDTSALVRLGLDEDGVPRVEAEVFAPKGNGVALELAVLEAAIDRNAREYDVQAVGYDPWAFEKSAQDLSDKGLLMVEIPQSQERLTVHSGELFEAINGKQLRHAGDPVLRAHVRAGATKPHERGWRLVKGKSRRPIDALMALSNAWSLRNLLTPSSGAIDWM